MDAMALIATVAAPEGVFGRFGDADAWLTVLGRLHVLAVHFPIALVIVGVLIEMFRLPKRKAEAPGRWRPSGGGLACVAIGAVAAGASAWSGWVYAGELGAGDEFTTHRWVGVAAAGTAGLAAAVGLFAWVAPQRGRLAGYRFVGLIAAVLVGLAGHFGGGLTHGGDHVIGPLRVALGMEEAASPEAGGAIAADAGASAGPEPDEVAPRAAEAPEVAGDASRAVATEAPVAFAGAAGAAFAQVEPILAGRCYRCHGAERQRGRLRLDVESGLLSMVVAGDVAASEMHRRITLPADDRKRMPREGDPLTAQQIAAIAAWIEALEGSAVSPGDAERDGQPAPPAPGAGSPADDAPAEPEETLPTEPGAPAPMPVLNEAQRAAREAALAELRRRGLVAQVVAQGVDACEVRFVGGVRFGDEELALLDGLQSSLVWLDLTASGITDAGAAELATFGRLRRLRLGETKIGDGALGALGDLEELESLDLHATGVTDARLVRLAGLRRLRSLYLWDTAVTADGPARLRARAPWVDVDK
jgi:uncharacterized membrane protein/mono/diheme cytochrome c family protein